MKLKSKTRQTPACSGACGASAAAGGEAAADVTEVLRLWLGRRHNFILALPESISGFLPFVIPKQFEPTLLVIWMSFTAYRLNSFLGPLES